MAVAQGDGFGVAFKGVSRVFRGHFEDISKLLRRSFCEVFSWISNFVKEIFQILRGKRARSAHAHLHAHSHPHAHAHAHAGR